MNLKQKLFNYFNNLMLSALILWVMLIVLNFNGLRPEMIIRFFFIFTLLLSLILYPRQIFILLKDSPRLLKHIVTNNIFWLILFIGGIFLDVFIFKFSSDLVILFLIGLWVISVRRYKFEGRISVGLALGFLILCPFLLIFKKELIAEKSAIWAYIFLVVGVVQLFIENFKEEKESVQKED